MTTSTLNDSFGGAGSNSETGFTYTEFLDLSFDNQNYQRKILSIDIGVRHLGLVLAVASLDYSLVEVVDFNLIDITRFTHHYCVSQPQDCRQYHTKTFADWLNHVFLEHPCFGQADTILIEQQPPTGFTVVEQLIFSRYRRKCALVHPRSVHAHFHYGQLDYVQRKQCSERLLRMYLSADQRTELDQYPRQHDIADAFCQLRFWLHHRHLDFAKRTQAQRAAALQLDYQQQKISVFDYLDTFQYRG